MDQREVGMYIIYGVVFLTMLGIVVAAEWGKRRKAHPR